MTHVIIGQEIRDDLRWETMVSGIIILLGMIYSMFNQVTPKNL